MNLSTLLSLVALIVPMESRILFRVRESCLKRIIANEKKLSVKVSVGEGAREGQAFVSEVVTPPPSSTPSPISRCTDRIENRKNFSLLVLAFHILHLTH